MELACHEYGCRIFSRLLEHAATDSRTIRLIDETLSEVDLLLTDTFGHHIVERVLEHGLAHQRRRIVAALRQIGVRGAHRRTVAYILEKALLYGNPEDQRALASDFSKESSSEEITKLAQSQLGCMVLRALLRLPDAFVWRVRQHLAQPVLLAQLRATWHGRRLLSEGSPGDAPDSASSSWSSSSSGDTA